MKRRGWARPKKGEQRAPLLFLLLLSGFVSWACDTANQRDSPASFATELERIGPPNIVLFLVDTLRADATSPYGFDTHVSPQLGRLAAEGIVFERVLAQSSWTKVSMASLLTSLWPQSHGIRLPSDGLAEDALTLQDLLRGAGYSTYAVQSNGWMEESFGFHHGFDHYVFPHATSMARELGTSSVWPHGERIFDEATRLLQAHDRDTPFFLYLHFMDVHEYAAPPEFKNFGNDQRAAYSAAVRWIDDLLERVGERLEEAGMAGRTLLIVASDHGEAFGENRAQGHARNVLTPVLEVPLIIHFPFEIRARRIETQVRNLDIAPTILDMAGIPIPEDFEGESLMPLIVSSEPAPARINFAALGAPIMVDVTEQVSVNDGVWSFARNLDEEGREFLFDRRVDSAEDANLVDLEPEQAARMRSLLDGYLGLSPRPEARAEKVWIDPGIAERLRAVGYLQ